MATAAPTRASRRKRKQEDMGPTNDPIRQQGRDPNHLYDRSEWYVTPQKCDRQKYGRRRMYHESYQTSSGHTWDQFFEELADTARELEDAGINLGWGGCKSDARQSVESEIDRRLLEPKANHWHTRLVTRKK
jgi:hypothetical protein